MKRNILYPYVIDNALSRFFKEFEPFINTVDRMTKYPPYNIVRVDDDNYTLEMAVAGFEKDEIDITWKKDTHELWVEGKKKDDEKEPEYIHRGIAGRGFKTKLPIAKDIEPRETKFENGMLTMRFKRVIPEDKQSVKIKID